MKGCLKNFYFHILNITKFGQIWLNILMDEQNGRTHVQEDKRNHLRGRTTRGTSSSRTPSCCKERIKYGKGGGHPERTPKKNKQTNIVPMKFTKFFFFSFLCYSWSGNHQEDSLVKFGYKQDMNYFSKKEGYASFTYLAKILEPNRENLEKVPNSFFF